MRRSVYLLRLRPLPNVDGLKMLRMALKILRRKYRLQALEISEIPDSNQENANAQNIATSPPRTEAASRA
jgi:hypothetical protein